MRVTASLREYSPSPPPGAERAGVWWGTAARSPTPTSPSPRFAAGPSLSPLKGGEGNVGRAYFQTWRECYGSQPDPEMVGDGEDVLVAAAAHVHHDQVVGRQARRDLGDMGECVGGFERRDDALEPARQLKRLERLVIADRDVLDAPDVVQPGMLGTDAGVI